MDRFSKVIIKIGESFKEKHNYELCANLLKEFIKDNSDGCIVYIRKTFDDYIYEEVNTLNFIYPIKPNIGLTTEYNNSKIALHLISTDRKQYNFTAMTEQDSEWFSKRVLFFENYEAAKLWSELVDVEEYLDLED